ncbi:hypothetical protein [Nocardia brasiliensis]|uniref:hypothetical protein n=1 Tax=Nocardia brasiliensis TaxID=37326 RepID=UPI002454C2F7|nr:hypothetical protein [Nocardia brasiliensis]
MLDIPFLLTYLSLLVAVTLLYGLLRLSARHPSPIVAPPSWPYVLIHDAPSGPLGIWEAHVVMRQHGRCDIDECARKRTAFTVLIEAEQPAPTPPTRSVWGKRMP